MVALLFLSPLPLQLNEFIQFIQISGLLVICFHSNGAERATHPTSHYSLLIHELKWIARLLFNQQEKSKDSGMKEKESLFWNGGWLRRWAPPHNPQQKQFNQSTKMNWFSCFSFGLWLARPHSHSHRKEQPNQLLASPAPATIDGLFFSLRRESGLVWCVFVGVLSLFAEHWSIRLRIDWHRQKDGSPEDDAHHRGELAVNLINALGGV